MGCGCLGLVLGAFRAEPEHSSGIAVARKARDAADVDLLRRAIDQARSEAQQHGTAGVYERLAQFELWLCEAVHGSVGKRSSN